MNILYIVPYVPSPIRVRPFNLIKNLAERGNRVTVLTLWTDQQDLADVWHLKKLCHQVHAAHLSRYQSMWNCLRAIPSSVPLQAVYCWLPKATQSFWERLNQRSRLSSYDVIHVEHLRGAKYALWLEKKLIEWDLSVPIVWDSVDCISLLFTKAAKHSSNSLYRLLIGLERDRTARFESKLTSRFGRILVTSPEDLEALTALKTDSGKSTEITVLKNGVDLDFFAPVNRREVNGKSLLISGKMSYHANVSMTMHFVQNILPRIRVKCSDVELWIVGKDPAREIRALSTHPNIHVTGTVPDIRPYFQRASIAAVPLTYGVGIQNKVLEAMAMGVPVISTSQAVKALTVQAGRDVVVADGEEQFADAIVNLLENPTEQELLAINGRAFVTKNHGWGTTARQLEEIYYGVLNDQS